MDNRFFNGYPYTDFHELNLSWVISELRSFATTLEQFVSINALKYADPIDWNITTQYEKNTIVIDPLTGTAYISVQPVPSGVALTNTDYWTVVFNLGEFIVKASKNFTNKYEEATTTTATFNTPKDSWLIWGDELYNTLTNITAGDTYVVGGNIIHFTMEDVIGHLNDLLTTDKDNLVAAINEVLLTLTNTTGSLDDLNTTDKSNLVAAINETKNDIQVVTGLVDFYFPPNNDGIARDSTMLMVVNKRGYLFDTGFSYNRATIITYYQSLFTSGIVENIDKIFISHYHADHYSLLPDILASFPHDDCLVYLPMNFDGYYSGSEYTSLLNDRNTVINTLTSYNVPYIEVNSVTDIDLENDVNIRLLNSTPDAYNYYKTDGTDYYNNYCMFSLISVGDNHIYFLADIQGIAEQYAVNNYELPRAYLCVLNHHAQQWDDVISFINALSPYIGVFQTNTTNIGWGGIFVNYKVDHIYSTANGSISAHLNKSGGIINGVETFRKGTPISTIKIYVDNTYTGASNGDINHPFKSVDEAVQFLPRDFISCEISIYLKGTATTYSTIALQGVPNDIFIRDWDGSPTVNGFFINKCQHITFGNIIFEGLQQFDTNYGYIGRAAYSFIVFNSCTFKSDTASRINGINILLSELFIQGCTFDTITQTYDTTLSGKVFAIGSAFNNVGYCYSMASTDLTIRGVDTIDSNTDYYLRSTLTTLMTPCNIILASSDDLTAFKALCAKNNSDVISNYFKHGDSILAIVGTKVISSAPISKNELVSDLNDIDSTGFFTCLGGATNKPSGVSVGGNILNLQLDINNRSQIFIARDSDTIYIRQNRLGTWTSWKSLTPT